MVVCETGGGGGGDGSWNISVARSFRRYGWVTMDRSISVA